jgi:hypothetical protein
LTADAAKPCELCELARTTKWFATFYEPFKFTVLECDSCDVPMAVLGEHRQAVSAEERKVMERALQWVADTYDMGELFFDDRMRQIPDHYHLHARVRPKWWPSPGGA